jgi:hypothetical protein
MEVDGDMEELEDELQKTLKKSSRPIKAKHSFTPEN